MSCVIKNTSGLVVAPIEYWSGNIYVAGRLYYFEDWNGDPVFFKLDLNGELQWAELYSWDPINSLVGDGVGNLYITGPAEFAWPGPNGESPLNPHNSEFIGEEDIFVLKLNDGTAPNF